MLVYVVPDINFSIEYDFILIISNQNLDVYSLKDSFYCQKKTCNVSYRKKSFVAMFLTDKEIHNFDRRKKKEQNK
jgi:hypothetical protein